MTGPRLPAGTAFSLAVPASWFEHDVHPDTRESSLDRLLEEQVRDVPELRPHRTALSRLLREQAAAAWDAGAAYSASMVEPTDDGPVVASVVALVVPGPVDGDTGLDALLAPFAPEPRTQDDRPWRETGTVEVSGIGACGRSWGVSDVVLPDDSGTVRVVTMQTLVPLPQRTVLLLTCSSPVLALVDDLLDLFEAVSDTLEVHVGQEAPAP